MGFRYQSLNPNEIRLLKPISQSPDSLSFEIVHTSLCLESRYVALSYTWGPSGQPNRILLNGQHFLIRQNLSDALQQIQRSKLVEKFLWVDAICINQGENEDALQERSVQITLMKQIYEQAAKILVWLGKPENEANNRLAFPLMMDFEKRFRHTVKKARPFRPWWWQTAPRTTGDDAADFLLTISPAKDKKVFDVPGSHTYRAWLGIISLWKSPWWTRTWIFQEATIPERYWSTIINGVAVLPNPSKVRFLCGDQESSWNELAATSLVATSIISTPGIDSEFLAGANMAFHKLLMFRGQRVQNILRSFLDILQMFRHTECFDPRDKVYAPLCLAPDDVRRYIMPDYASKSVFDVYADVVRYYLAQPGHDLDFLGCAMYVEEAQAVTTPQGVRSVLPSWVPNFSASLDIVPVPKILHVPEEKKDFTVYKSRIASNQEALIAAYRPLGEAPSRSFIEDRTLFVSGVFIDIIKDIIPNTGPDLEVVRAVGKEKGRQWAIDSKHNYFTGESYADVIKRTPALDVVYDDRGRPSERGGKIDFPFLRKPRAELTLVEYRYQMNMRTASQRASALRNLGQSQKLYLLMIANTSVVGDTIWALAGGRALYVLRPLNREMGQYRFIGECYAHGLMDGEIMRRLNVREARMEDISLI